MKYALVLVILTYLLWIAALMIGLQEVIRSMTLVAFCLLYLSLRFLGVYLWWFDYLGLIVFVSAILVIILDPRSECTAWE